MTWGDPPWSLTLPDSAAVLPGEADVAVVGAGFTGLAAACFLRRQAPDRRVAVLHAGGGASTRTGGLVLDESAAGPLPGLGDVLDGYAAALRELNVDAELRLTGAWEISRTPGDAPSPLTWVDEGTLRVADVVEGGTFHPGRTLEGLARSALASGATIHAGAKVNRVTPGDPVVLEINGRTLRARHVLMAVNGAGAWLFPWAQRLLPRFTLAVATAPLNDAQARALCEGELKPFYTLDLPYLWGRPFERDRLIIGGGIVDVASSEELAALSVESGESAERLARLETRIRGLRPELASLEFTHRWGGPVLSRTGSRPLFCRHPGCDRIMVLGSFSGHGNALSVHLARWAARALLDGSDLPDWGRPM